MPEELQRIRSMDEWFEKPAEFRSRFRVYIEKRVSTQEGRCVVLQQWGTYVYYRETLYVFTVV